jgi:tetratricopeptide (TPR) repeat protein
MRTAALALLVTAMLFALAMARSARAGSQARAAVDAANAALTTEPPKLDAARADFERAIAANDDPDAVAEAYFGLGRLDEAQGAFARALSDDRAAMAAAPDTRWAIRAADRVEWLRARSEGGFAPLARLERVRRDPALSEDPAAIDALAKDAESFPPGLVRVEARMLVAEAWLGRMRRPDDAVGELRKVTADPRADPLTVRLAERELVDALAGAGHIDEAVAEAHAHAARLDPRFLRQVDRLLRRRAVRRVSVVVMAAFVTLATAALARARRRRALIGAWQALRSIGLVAALFVVFLAGAGGVLASSYESGNATPFVALAAAVLPLVLVARAWGAVGSEARAARIGRALLCGASVVATAFLLLDMVNPTYLEGFGL